LDGYGEVVFILWKNCWSNFGDVQEGKGHEEEKGGVPRGGDLGGGEVGAGVSHGKEFYGRWRLGGKLAGKERATLPPLGRRPPKIV